MRVRRRRIRHRPRSATGRSAGPAPRRRTSPPPRRLLRQARRPIIVAGGGVVASGARDQVLAACTRCCGAGDPDANGAGRRCDRRSALHRSRRPDRRRRAASGLCRKPTSSSRPAAASRRGCGTSTGRWRAGITSSSTSTSTPRRSALRSLHEVALNADAALALADILDELGVGLKSRRSTQIGCPD